MGYLPLSSGRARKPATECGSAARLNVFTVGCLLVLSVPLGSALAQQPITFQYFYDDLNQLATAVDSTGVVIQYVYDPVGNILQINRSVLSAPGALSIFSASPRNVSPGGTLTIQGQGFNTTPSLNVVTIGGVAVMVISATSTTLVVAVPANGVTGQISVTAGNATAISSFKEAVSPAPVISSVLPHAGQAGTTVSVQVTGANLTGSTFSISAGLVLAAVVNAAGTSATLTIQVAAGVNGRFPIVGFNNFGSSAAGVTLANVFGVYVDPNADADNDGLANGLEQLIGTDPFNPDSDGDGFSDGVEVASGSNPLDPACTPLNCRFSGTAAPVEIDTETFSALNAGPASAPQLESDSRTFSVLDAATATSILMESDSRTFSVLNTLTASSSQRESDSRPFSVLNTLTANSSPRESDSIPFSVCNSAGTCSGYSGLSRSNGNGTPQTVTGKAGGAGGAGAPVDRPPFTVLSVAPGNGALNLDRRYPVTLAFSSPLDPASINPQNFSLTAGDRRLDAELRYSTDFRTVMLRATLPPNTSIRVLVSGQVQDLWGRQLPAFESEFHTVGVSLETAAPVIAQRPPAGATGVDSGSPIRLYLDKAIDANLAGNAIRITQGGDPVEGAVSITEGGKVAEFVPYMPLLSGAVVQVAWGGVPDANGRPMAGYEGLFTTAPAASEVADAVRAVPGRAVGTALNPLIEIEYSRPLDAATVAAGNVMLTESSTALPVAAGIQLRGDRIIRILPAEPLKPDSSYTYEVSGDVHDLTGLPATLLQQSLTTGTESAFALPRLLSAAPPEGATDVETTSEIRLTFDWPVNPLTLSGDTVWLIQDGVREAVSISLGKDGREVVLTPEVPLKASSRVEVTITGVEDLSGNTLPFSSIRFQVRAASKLIAAQARGKTSNLRASGLLPVKWRVFGFLIGRR